MSNTLTTNLTVTVQAPLTNTSSDGVIATDPLSKAFVDSLASGVGLDQADKLYHATRTLALSSAETLDLYGGLADGFGNTLNFVKIKLLLIWNKSATAGYNLVVGAASAPFETWTSVTGSTIKVGPGGLLLLYNPSLAAFGVTNTTADGLKINNGNAGSVDYDIVIVGCSA